MAAKYNLQPQEVMLLKESSVMHSGMLAAYKDELMLTNQNLVLVKKGVLGNSKGILVLPLNQIKMHNKQPQVAIGKSPGGSNVLEVYFQNRTEQFGFASGGKRKLNEWVAKIYEAVTGESAPGHHDAGKALPGSEAVAGVLKDTIGVFKSKFGAAPEAPVKAGGQCRGCSAPLSGFQGQTVTCEYCLSPQQL